MQTEHRTGQGPQEYLSTGEAARILGVHYAAVWQMIQRGRLPGMKVGRNWIIPRDALLEFAKDYVKGPGPQWKRVKRERERGQS